MLKTHIIPYLFGKEVYIVYYDFGILKIGFNSIYIYYFT